MKSEARKERLFIEEEVHLGSREMVQVEGQKRIPLLNEKSNHAEEVWHPKSFTEYCYPVKNFHVSGYTPFYFQFTLLGALTYVSYLTRRTDASQFIHCVFGESILILLFRRTVLKSM